MSDPQRPPLQERSRPEANRLQIRVVPYSPPRISSELSATTRSARDSGSPAPAPWPENVEVYTRCTASPDPLPEPSSPAAPLTPFRRAESRDGQDQSSHAASRRPSTSSSLRRPRHVINVHADKTFSLQPQPQPPLPDSSSSVYSSSFLTSTISSTSHGRGSSSAAFGSRRRSSLLTAQYQDSAPTSPDSQSSPYTPHAKNPVGSTSSPWNYEFVGGVRKVVDETPDWKLQVDLSPIASPSPSYGGQRANSASHQQPQQQHQQRLTKTLVNTSSEPSLRASTAGSGGSDQSNIRVLGPSSPNVVLRGQTPAEQGSFTPASNANYHVLGDSASSDYSLGSQSRPRTDESEPNYIRHGSAPSPLLPSKPSKSRLRPEFSRESMVVPPLNPVRSLLPERPTSAAQKTMTPPRLVAVWSAMVRQDAARALFGSRAYPARRGSHRSSSRDRELPSHSSVPRSSQFQMQSPLSTVFSESEASERPSRSFSAGSPDFTGGSGTYVWDGSPGPSTMPYPRQPASSEGSIDWPQPVYTRPKEREAPSPNPRMVGDQDEHGDGLTDLTDLRDLIHHRPSRRGLSTVITSYPSDRNLRSSASARAYGLSMASIPTWARVYYGSGEHRYLLHQASRDSMRSDFTDSQGSNSILGRTPSLERFAFSSSRRRQRAQQPETEAGPSMPPKRSYTDLGWAWTLKKQTSSLWSPHLRRDKRASKYHIWEPPAGALSFDGNMAAKRNVQIVLFVAGFLFPPAWIVAAFLPLPPHHDLTEKDFPSTSHIDMAEDGPSPVQLAKENNIHSRASWWRVLNRVMAVVGLLVIGVFAVLIALGVRQQWTT